MSQINLLYPSGNKWAKHPVDIEVTNDNLIFRFAYNLYIKDEIKVMDNARWNPELKVWTAKNCRRNLFQLEFLAGHNPYRQYDLPLVPFEPKRDLFVHQNDMCKHILTRKQCICAVDTGLGKTLAGIEALESLLAQINPDTWWWIGPKSALYSVQLEFMKWKAKLRPKYLSYEQLVKMLAEGGKDAPQFVFFDEAQKVKTPTSQRAQAAYFLAENVRAKWKEDAYIVLMSGTPAPKSPLDWYHLCISGDTWILTDKGHKQAKDLLNQNCKIYVDGILYDSPTGTFISGKKEVFRVITEEGFSFDATLEHEVKCETFDGLSTWKKLKDLYSGQKLCLNNNENIKWEADGTWKEGYLLGLLIGDGCITKRKKKITKSSYDCTISLFKEDRENAPFIQSCFVDQIWEQLPKTNLQKDGRLNINTVWLDHIRAKYEMDETKQITKKMEESSKPFLAGLISGLFDTDGTMERKRLRVRLTQSNFDCLQKVQRILLMFGIYSKILLVIKEGIRKVITVDRFCKDHYVLLISGEHVKTFQENINFHFKRKRELLEKQLTVNSQMSPKFLTTFVKLESLGEQEVYDISVPNIKTFSGNGFKLHNCEIACPGFIREGNINKFRNRLALMEKMETGYGVFPKLITWWDDERKCGKCGKFKEQHKEEEDYHFWIPSKNEVAALYERLSGLVLVRLKSECLDLPPKMYETIKIKPSAKTLRLADLLGAKADRAITKLTWFRELSDGFIYKDTETKDMIKCPSCRGTKEVVCAGCNGAETDCSICNGARKDICYQCGGEGEVAKWVRETEEVTSPKETVLEELLELYEDGGRVVISAAFTGSIDKCVRVATKNNWNYIRIDGRGWHSNLIGSVLELLHRFQEGDREEKIAVIINPGSGSTGLTLTASPVIIRYSNDFNGANFFQLEDRIYRIGTKAAKIIDLIHLPSDLYVLENQQKKRKLQDLSMGELSTGIKNIDMTDWREV